MVVIAGVVVAVLSARQRHDRPLSGLTAGGCQVDGATDPGGGHVSAPTFRVDPPSGGDHLPLAASAGFYEPGQAPPDGASVYSLQHGYVDIGYRPTLDPAALDPVRRLFDTYGKDTLVLPHPSLSQPIAATAWHHRLLCGSVDTAALHRLRQGLPQPGPREGPPHLMSHVLFGTTVLIAVAGIVALLARCCISVMLPAYFANSFRRRRALVSMTVAFALGVSTVFLPVGFGATALSRLVIGHHFAVFLASGLAMIALGLATATGWRVPLPMPGMQARNGKGGSGSVYLLGVFSGTASACCAPVIALSERPGRSWCPPSPASPTSRSASRAGGTGPAR